MKILVTGGAGFIGSNFVRYMLSKYSDVDIVNFDKLTYAGNRNNLIDLEDDPRYSFVRGDIVTSQVMSKYDSIDNVLNGSNFDAIINIAAETHVDRSLVDAGPFVQSNVVGTQMLIEAVREHKVPRFVQVSTDEVYGTLGADDKFTESTPLAPNNPYSATKASADCLINAAVRCHNIDAVITRCSNNFGPYQFPEKLIPLMIANALEDKELPVYGDGMHVRDWIFVEDHCSGIDAVLRKGRTGEVYNIGGDYDVPNLDIVRTILRIVGKPESLIRFVDDRPGHDRRYAMDSSRIQNELGWKPAHSFDDAIQHTITWYREHSDWVSIVKARQEYSSKWVALNMTNQANRHKSTHIHL